MSLGAQDSAKASVESSEETVPAKPFFEITRGNPSPVEVGILTAVFATAQGNAAHSQDNSGGIKNDWGSYEDRLRSPFGYNPSSFLNRRQY